MSSALENNPKLSFVLVLKKDIPPLNVSKIIECLQANEIGYYMRKSPADEKSQVLLLYVKNFQSFLLEAEKMRIKKPKILKRSFNEEYLAKLPEGPYSSFVKMRKNLNKNIVNLEKLSGFSFANKHKFTKETDLRTIAETVFDSEEYLRIFHSLLLKMQIKEQEKSTFFMDFLEDKNFLEELIPLHDGEKNPYNTKSEKKNSNMKKYLGEQNAYYFFFLSFLQKWLIVPAILGSIVMLFNRTFNEDVEESPFESLYSGFMVFWAASFVIFWEKKQKTLSFKWCDFGKSIAHSDTTINTKEANQGLLEQLDPVSGEKVLIYSSKKRFLRYLESFLISVPILALTLAFLFFSLNLRGYVSEDHPSIYLASISALAQDGAIFDQNAFMGNIPVLFHVIVLFNINSFYSSVSKWTSHREYHKTAHGEENSLIVKRVIFETFNTFVDLIYLAFIKLDIASVRRELISIYMFDELRRIITETLIPYIMRKATEFKAKHKISKEKSFDVSESFDKVIDKKLIEITLNKYESFDDYLEIVINFAYITLFASAFPLAPALILFFHYLESLSDRYKILKVYQRPLPERAPQGIGSWLGVLRIISILSVLSNLVLFAFSSEKMSEFFPFLFKVYHVHVKGNLLQGSNNGNLLEADIKSGMGRYVVLIVFLIEHFCFIGFWIIQKIANGREDWTDVYKKRKEFKLKINKRKLEEEGEEKKVD